MMRRLDRRLNLPLRRIITLDAQDLMVSAQISDNVHDFRVVLHHDGVSVTDIEPTEVRVPWTTCPYAMAGIKGLAGQPLSGGPPANFDKALQCTHLYDLTKLAMAQAQRGGYRRYDVTAELTEDDEGVVLEVQRNGEGLVKLEVRQGAVTSAGLLHGFLLTGPVAWPVDYADPDLREGVLLLRRAHLVFVESGPNMVIDRATDLPQMAGACFTFQPDRVASAVRPRDFHQYAADEVADLLR